MTPLLDPTLTPDPSPAGRGEDIKPDEPPDEPTVIPVNCERCYSTDIHRIPKVRIFLAGTGILLTYALMSGREGTLILFLAILSLALVLLFLDRWRCRECGHTWSDNV